MATYLVFGFRQTVLPACAHFPEKRNTRRHAKEKERPVSLSLVLLVCLGHVLDGFIGNTTSLVIEPTRPAAFAQVIHNLPWFGLDVSEGET
jgi:hypothetical protein